MTDIEINSSESSWPLDGHTPIDLTWPIGERLSVAPEYPPVVVSETTSVDRGDVATAELVSMGLHVGTHVDVPSHFYSQRETVDQARIFAFSGPALVVDVAHEPGTWGEVTARELLAWEQTTGEQISLGDVVLLRSGYSALWQTLAPGPRHTTDGWSFLGTSALDLLIDRDVRAVGVETPDPDRRDPTTNEAHRRLLGAGIYIVEHLANLDQITVHRCGFLALALPFEGCSGSPVRAVALV